MVQPFKIGSVPAGQQSTIQQNSTELLYEIYKNSPVLQGVDRDVNGNFDFQGKQLENIPLPSTLEDIATQAFANSYSGYEVSQEISYYVSSTPNKIWCLAASTPANGRIPLTGAWGTLVIDSVPINSPSFQPVIDGLTGTSFTLASLTTTPPVGAGTAIGLILLKDQGVGYESENGIYVVRDAGSGNYVLERHVSAAIAMHFQPEGYLIVQAGAVNATTQWKVAVSSWYSLINPALLPNPYIPQNFVPDNVYGFIPGQITFVKRAEKATLASVSGTPSLADLQAHINNTLLPVLRAAALIKN